MHRLQEKQSRHAGGAGTARGPIEVLSRQLGRRFGDLPAAARARIEAAPLDLLHVWLDQAPDARDLDALSTDAGD